MQSHVTDARPIPAGRTHDVIIPGKSFYRSAEGLSSYRSRPTLPARSLGTDGSFSLKGRAQEDHPSIGRHEEISGYK